jgi:hypothetical protein
MPNANCTRWSSIAAPEVLGGRLRIRSTRQLRIRSTRQLVAACARLRLQASWDVATTTTAATLAYANQHLTQQRSKQSKCCRPVTCGVGWGWQASNLRPGGYEPPALTD